MVKTVIAYIKGVMHAIVIPYLLLWIFGGFSVYGLVISTVYVALVGTLYTVSDREKFMLSRKAFINVLFFLIDIVAIFSLIVLLGILQK